MAFLPYSVLQFPYESDRIGTWFEQEILRPGFVEPGCLPVRSKVKMINMRKGSEILIPHFKMMEVLPSVSPNESVYYHGTSDTHAVDIMKNGIDLTKSRPRQDFSDGNGFYVIKNIDKAIRWANKRAEGGTGAIIAFKISQDLEKEEPNLSLEVRTAEGRKLWTKVVSYCRKGLFDRDVVLLLYGKKFITGPAGRRNTTPYDFNQTCICDADYAKRFGRLQNILCVIFIG